MRPIIAITVMLAFQCAALTAAEQLLEIRPAAKKALSNPEIAALGKASTALVELPKQAGFGSAFCIDTKGFFVTDCHVVETAGDSVSIILFPGEKTQKKLTAKVLCKDKELDLAILKVDNAGTAVHALELGVDKGLSELQEVIAFGFPFGKELAANATDYPAISINTGHITALRKKDGKLNRIQMDAVVNPGNSGGPVLDKNGQVIGIVVSGILGAGAVNFAIPVSHLRQFMVQPIIAFTPPVVTRENQHELLDFRATATAMPMSPGPIDLELLISSPLGDERHFDLNQYNGVYAVRAVPFPSAKVGNSVRVEIKFPDGSIIATCPDREMKAGEKSCRLSDTTSVKLGVKGSVLLKDGNQIPCVPGNLGSLPLRLGGQTIDLRTTSAREIRVIQPEELTSVLCTIVAKQHGKEVGRLEVPIYLDGVPPAAVADAVVGDAPGLAPAAPPAGAANNGAASLENLIEGNFNRPRRAARRTSYLKVLSTAGDYIGQGKRYEYGARDMVVKATEGLVKIEVDGWTLEFAPGRGKLLKVGIYDKAKRYPFNNTMPGIDFSGQGRGSNTIAGKFIIYEFVRQGTEIKTIAIDFVQRSDETGPPLVGMFRYNSSCE